MPSSSFSGGMRSASNHVIGVTLGANPVQVPRPSAFAVIECEQSLVSQRADELNREERIATGLLVDKLCERGSTIRLAVNRIRNQLLEIVTSQGGKHDF